jgi:superfamily II DNA or RNA helicase
LIAIPQLSDSDLHAHIALNDLRRARGLLSNVSNLQVRALDQGFQISALVQGSMRKPYETTILLQPNRTGWQLQSSCTCPIGVACKHTAVLWLAAKQGESGVEIASSKSVAQFMQELRAAAPEALDAIAAQRANSGSLQLYLQLMLDRQEHFATPLVRPLLAVLEDQRLHVQAELSPFRLLPDHAKLLSARDISALKELEEFEPSMVQGRHWYPLVGARGMLVLDDAIRWARLVQVGQMGEPILPGTELNLALIWRTDERGYQHLGLSVQNSAGDDLPQAVILDTEGLSVLHTPIGSSATTLCRVRSPLSLVNLRNALLCPPLRPDFQDAQLTALRARFGSSIPAAKSFIRKSLQIDATPVLRLSLTADREALIQHRLKRRLGYARQLVDLGFDVVPIGQYVRGVERVVDQSLVRYEPNQELIAEWAKQCQSVRLEKSTDRLSSAALVGATDWLINADYDEQTLSEFCFLGVPKLKQMGWRVEYNAGFPLKLIEQPISFTAEVTEGEGGQYFDLALGVEINGQKVPLLPILQAGLAQGRYQNLPEHPDAIVALYLPEGPVPITAARLRLMLAVLHELSQSARLPRMRAGIINELDAELAGELRWHGDANLRPLAERLEGVQDLPDAVIPKSLQATLRPYQVYGLRWLRFLSQTELAGILADDMGLGKTVQVLAHILAQREAAPKGKNVLRKAPVLVIAPTSVLPNWRAEIARFTPTLKVLSLSGNKRASKMMEIPSVDIVLSTYALLGRDLPKLLPFDFDMLVLDEAQLVKNPNTLAARAVRQLRAKHRLCMTGTPLENHLGELWAQFDFLMPGFLGAKASFQKNFRLPIEKRQDSDVAARLRERIAPFLLRRTKDQVVSELPPKSVIVKRVELEGKQRDVYETLRVQLKASVNQQLAERGMEKGRISLLDALLKLRQVCCDPRLLQMESAHSAPSAKLDQLMEMLQSLIAEGRRILLFSQFTSMLALIEAECARRKLRYLILTGQSDDRETPVKRFQNKEVPLFLISLRAGGVGLNLTAADTVIHYDPWWNPAVEEQATDRAYRIGQDKAVFVYRLIAAGTVEERIEEMKVRKRELADVLFDEAAAPNFSAEELLSLLDG